MSMRESSSLKTMSVRFAGMAERILNGFDEMKIILSFCEKSIDE